MENTFSVSNKENTFIVSIGWQNDMDKDDKAKVHSLLLQALKLWESTEAVSKVMSEKLKGVEPPVFPSDRIESGSNG